MTSGDLQVVLAMLRGPGSSRARHAERLQRLYRDQAGAYDRFREGFLHGRRELVERLPVGAGARVVELGAGTGANAEHFGDRLETFASVHLVDLCPALLEVARGRCRRPGWACVRAAEGDACAWRPPDGRPVDAVFFSYSLTMIPEWFRAVDNAVAMLKPGGWLGSVDFYLLRTRHGALGRTFWRAWFGHNAVHPSTDHLAYLSHRTQEDFVSERSGRMPYVPFLRAPYYLFIGRKPAG
jgi:S-adenosylmethionine-diacylgycerolhomoserine-N-methlytransferase